MNNEHSHEHQEHHNCGNCNGICNECNTCDMCILITNDCLHKYTPLEGSVLLENILSSVLLANTYIEGLIGLDCFEKLCQASKENEGDDKSNEMKIVLKHRLFRQFYARVIYKFWLIERGAGSPTDKGTMSFEGSDGFDNDYRNASKENEKRIAREETIIQGLQKQFLKWFNSLNLKCVECEEEKECNTCNQCKCAMNQCKCKVGVNDYYAATI